MNKNLHDIDDLFRNSIDGHAEVVPPDVWNNIDHSLDKKQAAFYKRKYFSIRAAAILLLLIGGATIAAILHYHSSARQLTDETMVTEASGNEVEKDPTKTSESLKTVQNAENQKPAVLGDPEHHKAAQNDGIPDKEDSKAFQNTADDGYAAEKNREISAGLTARKINKQVPAVKFKPITGVSLSLVQQQQEQRSQERSNRSIGKNVEGGATRDFSRTAYVDVKILSASKLEIMNSLPAANITRSIIPAFPASSSAGIPRTGNSLGNWSVSLLYAQNKNLNTLKDDDQFRDPRNNSREAKRTEQETRSFTVGLGIEKVFSANFALQTGLQYFSSQTTITPKMIFAEPDRRGEVRYRFNCSSGDSYIPTKTGSQPVPGDSIRTNSSTISLSYLQMPFLASYKISLGKFSIVPSAGIQSNFLLSSKLTSSLAQPSGAEEVSGSIDGLRSIYSSGVLQPQINYRFNDRLSFDFNPNVNFSLTPINRETAVRTYQNMFSLGAGLRIKL